MKKAVIFLAMFFLFEATYAQIADQEKKLRTQQTDSIEGWKKGGVINLNTAQTSLTNWAAGGQSSVAIGGLVSLLANLKKDNGLWENYLDLGYGTMKQGKKTGWRKTDDKIDFTSKYGHRFSEHMYFAGLLNFKTQITPGYNYPNDSMKISDFMAPGYLLGALGIDYRPADDFTVFVAPFTGKFTFVTDQKLADAGAFGVDPGKNTYSEFGAYLRLFLKKGLMENIVFQTRLDLFSNYLHNPQNIDVSWETLLSMKINKFFSATISTHMLYDDDIVIAVDKNDDGITDEAGPRIQFKEVLAIGFSYAF
jgi:hypothetical protein